MSIPPAALSLVTSHSLMTWTLTTSKQDEEEVARVLSILEVTLRSIMDLWKRNSTSDLEKVITKLCDDILINCHSMLTSLKYVKDHEITVLSFLALFCLGLYVCVLNVTARTYIESF